MRISAAPNFMLNMHYGYVLMVDMDMCLRQIMIPFNFIQYCCTVHYVIKHSYNVRSTRWT